MATYIVSDDGFCPTCRSKEVFHVLSDELVFYPNQLINASYLVSGSRVRSGRIPAMHRFLLRNERAVVASDLMKTNGRQVWVGVSCYIFCSVIIECRLLLPNSDLPT